MEVECPGHGASTGNEKRAPTGAGGENEEYQDSQARVWRALMDSVSRLFVLNIPIEHVETQANESVTVSQRANGSFKTMLASLLLIKRVD